MRNWLKLESVRNYSNWKGSENTQTENLPKMLKLESVTNFSNWKMSEFTLRNLSHVKTNYMALNK